jgi:hypothetical protein
VHRNEFRELGNCGARNFVISPDHKLTVSCQSTEDILHFASSRLQLTKIQHEVSRLTAAVFVSSYCTVHTVCRPIYSGNMAVVAACGTELIKCSKDVVVVNISTIIGIITKFHNI